VPTVIVAAAVVRDGERLLLTRRPSGAHLEGLWEFPGGKLEEGESPEVALARECLEECGIDVVVEDVLDVAYHRYPKKDVLLLFYACRLGARREIRHLEVVDHAWVLPSELDRYELPPPDARLVDKLRRGVWPGAR
jgi:8-oxo-dGTP diphosphatase